MRMGAVSTQPRDLFRAHAKAKHVSPVINLEKQAQASQEAKAAVNRPPPPQLWIYLNQVIMKQTGSWHFHSANSNLLRRKLLFF